MIYSLKKNYIVPFFIILIIIIILLNLIIKPTLTIQTFVQVFPKEKWNLVKGTNGQLISCLIDYESGFTTQYNIIQFERGEQISLKYLFNIKEKKFFYKGDSIISIISSSIEDKLLMLEGELEYAKANLKSQSTGEKEALIKEAQNRLNYTIEKINEQKVIYQRILTLFEKGLISQQEYENQKWMLNLLEIEREINKAQLENISTGVKPEAIELIKSQIALLKSRLNLLKKRKNELTIISPISGNLSNILSQDTLITLINYSEIILYTPIKVTDLGFFNEGEEVKLQLKDFDESYSGLILSINKEVKILNNQQVIYISIKLDNKNEKLLPGMVLESLINVKKMSLFEYLQRLLIE